ncbi:MAG TPA: hypothetical protein VLA34_15145, partial [Candidatus Krumholzibacterium sp.]|nr:hypothetical protein [Candidatus Krumholzibacterium sp.]
AARGGRFEILSRSLFQKSPRDVVFAGGQAVLASGGAVALIGGPPGQAAPSIVHLDGEPYDLCASGNIVYAAAMGKGLVVLDLSGPDGPVVKNVYESPRAFLTGLFDGGLLLCDISGGLMSFDITDALSPVFEERLTTRGRPVSIAGCGASAAVACPKGISILVRGGSGRIEEVSYIKTEKDVVSVSGSDGWVAALFKDGTAACWDVSTPASPGNINDISPGTRISDLAIEGGGLYLFLASGRIETSAPGAWDLRGGRRLTASYDGHGKIPGVDLSLMEKISERFSGRARSGDFPGKRIATGPGSLVTFDPGGDFWIYTLGSADSGRPGDDGRPPGPAEAEFELHLDVRGFAIDLFASDGRLYLANGDDGLRIGDVSDDGSVEWVGRFKSRVARDVAVVGDMVVLADGYDGLKTIDAADPTDPRLLGSIDSPFYHSAVVTRGTDAYVAGGLGGTEIIDISRPERPRLVWRGDFSEVRGIFAGEKAFYFADGFEGFRIYGYGDPPPLISVTDTPGWVCDCFVSGDILYIAEGGRGIAVVDVSDPKEPVITGRVDIGSIAREIHLRGTTLFVASHKAGITAIDVSDPRNPSISARFPTVDDARGVFADERFVYLASGAGGVYILRYIED